MLAVLCEPSVSRCDHARSSRRVVMGIGRPTKRRRLALWALAAAAGLAQASPVIDALPPLDRLLVGRAEPLATALSIAPSPTAAPDRLGRRAVPLNSNGQPSYPATWLNINDMTTLGALSNVAVVRMQTWRGSNVRVRAAVLSLTLRQGSI